MHHARLNQNPSVRNCSIRYMMTEFRTQIVDAILTKIHSKLTTSMKIVEAPNIGIEGAMSFLSSTIIFQSLRFRKIRAATMTYCQCTDSKSL